MRKVLDDQLELLELMRNQVLQLRDFLFPLVAPAAAAPHPQTLLSGPPRGLAVTQQVAGRHDVPTLQNQSSGGPAPSPNGPSPWPVQLPPAASGARPPPGLQPVLAPPQQAQLATATSAPGNATTFATTPPEGSWRTSGKMVAMTEYRQPVDSTGQPVGSKYHFCCVCNGPILGLYEQHVRSRAHTNQIWQCFNTPGHYINVVLPLFTTEWPVFDFPTAEE